jgi:hypothetical protein
MKRFIVCSISLIFLFPLFSEEEDLSRKEVRSIREKREQTLEYGIDSEVLAVISQLKEEENDRYNDTLVEIFTTTSNAGLQEEIISFFAHTEDEGLYQEGRKLILSKWEDLRSSNLLALIRYLKDYQDEKLSDLFLEIADNPENRSALEAIRALGHSEGEKYIHRLKELYENSSEKVDRRAAVLDALGERESRESLPLLKDILLDEDQQKSLRWKACSALGKIGGEEALEAIMRVFGDEDPRLRQFAVQALGQFEADDTIVEALISALKDNNWRVRVQAADSLGEIKAKKAVDILIYKAKHDPDVHNVRTAAVRALGKIDSAAAYRTLRELYEDPTVPLEIRGASAEMLIEYDLGGSISTIRKVIEEEWTKNASRLLDYTCKQLSSVKDGSLQNLYAKMLTHPESINIILYGLRGIRNNGLSGLKEEVEKLTGESTHRSIRSYALSVLEEI